MVHCNSSNFSPRNVSTRGIRLKPCINMATDQRDLRSKGWTEITVTGLKNIFSVMKRKKSHIISSWNSTLRLRIRVKPSLPLTKNFSLFFIFKLETNERVLSVHQITVQYFFLSISLNRYKPFSLSPSRVLKIYE